MAVMLGLELALGLPKYKEQDPSFVAENGRGKRSLGGYSGYSQGGGGYNPGLHRGRPLNVGRGYNQGGRAGYGGYSQRGGSAYNPGYYQGGRGGFNQWSVGSYSQGGGFRGYYQVPASAPTRFAPNSAQCHPGFHMASGNVAGTNMLIDDSQFYTFSITHLPTSDSCGEFCLERDGCCSYSWSQSTKVCDLYTECDLYPNPISVNKKTMADQIGCEVAAVESAPQCDDYHELTDDRWAAVPSGRHAKKCDKIGDVHQSVDWKGDGWYRVSGQAGTRLAFESEVGHRMLMCGTHFPGFLFGEAGDLPQIGQTVAKTARFRFDAWNYPTEFDRQIKITHCVGGYYVFFLPNTPTCAFRYCSA